ncbi:CD180 antigen-like isoform X2 [Lycorma delicatula]|uniref:CD180 antigen-like isoform X2 n=1 Tax=Lycorma delicatula TaxID=130591 RepID=UPI003F512CAE
MSKLIWIVSWLFIKTAFANLCQDLCSCVDVTAYCKNLKLKIQFDDEFWNNTEKLKMVELDGNEFSHIRPFPRLSVEYLSLKNNSITDIEDGSFKLLSNLTVLDLSENFIHSEELRPSIFRGLYSPQAYEPLIKLKTLKLSSNKLHTLHPDVFEHLPKLESLSVDNNPFKFIDKSTVIALASIQNLKVLDLSYTGLKVLPEFMLHTPRLLTILNLSGNQFTSIPEEIANSHNLNTLYIDDNPIKEIDFPSLPDLEILHLNWMPKLERIGPNAFSNLTGLIELSLRFNLNLTEISSTAFSRVPADGSEGRIWPPLKRLYLSHNQLRYLESNLVGRWDLLDSLDLQENPWVCDCKNQWMVSNLLHQIRKMPTHSSKEIICHEPIEMKGISMEDLEVRQYHMRCLDFYGNRPERDGALLIGVIIGLFLAIPFSMAAIILYKRRNFQPRNLSRAFYSRADSKQFFVNT